MIWGILSTFFLSFSTIFRKKAMNFKILIGDFWFMFLWMTWWITLFTIFLLSGKLNLGVFTLKYILLTITIGCLRIASTLISQYVYKREKISLLAPYENLNKILSIIISFFLFWDVSVISLCIALLVVGIIFISSYNFKEKYIPKTIQIFSLNQVIISINTIIIWYMLLNISALDFFMIDKVFTVAILFTIIVINKDIFKIKSLDRKFLQTRITASVLGALAYILSLYVISEFWVTINILLSFIFLIFILTFSYLLLWDKPTKKSIIVSVVVVILVWLWFYFK